MINLSQWNIMIFKNIRPILISFLLFSICINSQALAQESFQGWIENFYLQAKKEGITRSTYDSVFDSVLQVNQDVLKKANYQPEFTTEIWDYLDSRVTPRSIRIGQEMAIKHKKTLDTIEEKFAVSRYIILAIWSMESNYGEVLTKTHRLHYIPEALATLAYADKKRAKFARNQLLAVLKMVQDKHITPSQLLGSWAGAMGHTQFIPTSYLAYNVNLDGVAGSDIWNSVPDALGTAASLLSNNGWQQGKTWGYEAIVPTSGPQYNEETMLISAWKNKGFRRISDKSFPRPNDKAILKLFNTTQGPGYLCLKNFFVIKRYNSSDFYALAVGVLADQIAGHEGMVQKWVRPKGALDLAGKSEVQTLLQAKGYYTGKIDGSIGSGSRKAIKEWQKDMDLPVNGVANQDLLDLLQK